MVKITNDKRTNNDLKSLTQKTRQKWATQTPLKTGGELRCSESVSRYWLTNRLPCYACYKSGDNTKIYHRNIYHITVLFKYGWKYISNRSTLNYYHSCQFGGYLYSVFIYALYVSEHKSMGMNTTFLGNQKE